MLFHLKEDQRKLILDHPEKNLFCILQDDVAALAVRANPTQWALCQKNGFEYRFHYALGTFDIGTVFRSYVNVITSTKKSSENWSFNEFLDLTDKNNFDWLIALAHQNELPCCMVEDNHPSDQISMLQKFSSADQIIIRLNLMKAHENNEQIKQRSFEQSVRIMRQVQWPH